MGFIKKFSETRATLIDAIKKDKITLHTCFNEKCTKTYQNTKYGKVCGYCQQFYCNDHNTNFIKTEEGLSCPICMEKIEKLKARETVLDWFKDPTGNLVPISECRQQNSAVIEPDQALTDVYLQFDHVDKHYEVYTREYDVKYYVNLLGESNSALSDMIVGKKKSKKPFRLSDKAVRSLFEILQYDRLSRFSHLYIWVLESIIHSSALGDLQFLKVLLNPPGQKLSLPKSTPMVRVCSHCDTMLLRQEIDERIVHDDFKKKECTYCERPLETTLRARKAIRVELDIKTTRPKLGVRSDVFMLGILYKLKPVHMKLSAQSMEFLWLNYQNLYDDKRIGPLSMNFKIQDLLAYYQGKLLLEGVITEIGPIVLQVTEWRSVELFPEDLIIF
jgi:hypothetical protein